MCIKAQELELGLQRAPHYSAISVNAWRITKQHEAYMTLYIIVINTSGCERPGRKRYEVKHTSRASDTTDGRAVPGCGKLKFCWASSITATRGVLLEKTKQIDAKTKHSKDLLPPRN